MRTTPSRGTKHIGYKKETSKAGQPELLQNLTFWLLALTADFFLNFPYNGVVELESREIAEGYIWECFDPPALYPVSN